MKKNFFLLDEIRFLQRRRIECIKWLGILIWIWIPLSYTEENPIHDRTPKLGEVKPFPDEGRIGNANPPGFVWLPEEKAKTYTLQCSLRADFASVEYEKKDLSLNVHCPSILLKAGTWYWRYAYTTETGNSSQWSRVRSFTLADNAPAFPEPTLDDLLHLLPKTHPKLFLRPESVQPFRQTLEKNHPELWKNFWAAVDRMMDATVTLNEPPPFPTGELRDESSEDIDIWRANQKITAKAVDHAANLAFAYLLTGEEKYGKRARDWMMAVVSWPPNGTTSYKINDECAMPILSRIARAYTWGYSALSETDRQKIIAVMTERGREVYRHLRVDSNHTDRPYNSHNNRAWHFLGEAAIAFIADASEAPTWLQYAMDIFYNVYPVWGDDDGGWHEGIAYWRGYMEKVSWWLDIIDAAFGIDGYVKPFFHHVGDFPLYVNSPKSVHAGFGDSADDNPAAFNGPLMELFALHTKNPNWLWYASETYTATIPSQPTYENLLRASLPSLPASQPETIPNSKIFHGVGIASLHANLAYPANDVHLLFKSSPFGRQSHGYNAQNSFLLYAYGKPLLIASGKRDWHGSPHHINWMWETFSDNSITVNGLGQKKNSAEARGKIVGEFLNPIVDYVAGDASEAYTGQLKQWIRHVFFVKPDLILLVDDLQAPEPANFQFHLHAYEPFVWKNQFDVNAKNETSAVRIAFATPANAVISQTSGFVPPPVGLKLEQWHLQVETQEKSSQVQFVTLMKTHPSRTGNEVMIRSATRENLDIYGLAIDTKRLGLVSNPTRKDFTLGDTRSDAALMLIIESLVRVNESHILAIDATYIEVGGKRLAQSEKRGPLFLPWDKISPAIQKK